MFLYKFRLLKKRVHCVFYLIMILGVIFICQKSTENVYNKQPFNDVTRSKFNTYYIFNLILEKNYNQYIAA